MKATTDQIKIPVRADEPIRLFIWTFDEFVPPVAGIGVGIAIEQQLVCIAIGLIMALLYRRYRDQHPDGFVYHTIYKWGFGFTRSRSMINPYIRRLVA